MYKGGHIPESKHHLKPWQIEQRLRKIEPLLPSQCKYGFYDLQENLNKNFPEFKNRISVLVINNIIKITIGSTIVYEHNNINKLLDCANSPNGYISVINTNKLSDNALSEIDTAIFKYKIDNLDL